MALMLWASIDFFLHTVMPEEATEFSWGKEAAAFVAENFDNLYAVAKKAIRASEAKIRAKLEKTYSDYLNRVWTSYSRGQSFFVRDPTYLYDFYVPLPILQRKQKSKFRIEKPSVSDIFRASNAVIITGGGGSGKSMFVRHLILDCLFKKSGIPVFIELRNFVDKEIPENLHDVAYGTASLIEPSITKELFLESLRLGHFSIFLDGFDELADETQKRLEGSMRSFANDYPKVHLLVASRPDNMFTGWHGFSHLQMAPLTKEEAISFVDIQKFDSEIIELFKNDLGKDGFFEKHSSFLSNPLLLTIMLLTYEHSASVPKRLSEFYENAFEALFQRHDILKGGYKRPRASNLDYVDFGRAFSAFCMHSYFDKCVAFNSGQLLEYAEKSRKTTQLKFDRENFLRDCVKAVCLLIEEGLRTFFVHRSFQEFFAAKFIASCSDNIAVELLRRIEERTGFDRVHEIVHEINPALVECQYLAQRIREIRDSIGYNGKVTITMFLRFLKRNYDAIEFGLGSEGMAFLCRSGGERYFRDHNLVRVASKLCGLPLWMCSKELMKKYSNNDQEMRFEMDDCSIRDQIVKDLFANGGLISGKGLEKVFKLPEVFAEKEKSRISSLEDILGG